MSDKNGEQTPPGDESANGAQQEPEMPKAEPADEQSGEASPSGWAAGALEVLKEENADLKDRLLRAAAEMENVRRRTERDKADSVKFAISNFARDVLTIGDNIARAIEHVPDDAAQSDPALKSFLEGMQVTERELLNVMERHGIARHDPKGERFDPNKHQAMFEVDDADVAEGTIVEVVQAGYVIADRVLRPALVGIAKGGAKPGKHEETKPAETPHAANDDTKQAAPEQTAPEQTAPEQASPEQAAPEQAAPEQASPEVAKATKKKNPSAGHSPRSGKKKVGGKIDKNA